MSKQLKLLALTHNYPRFKDDFAGVFIHRLMKKLSEFDIEPIVLAPHHAGAEECEEFDSVRVHRFRYAERDEDETLAYQGQMHKLVLGSVAGPFRFRSFLDKFQRAADNLIQQEKIDIIAGHWLIPAGLVMKPLHRKYPNIPMILSSHGTDIRLMSRYASAVYRYLKNFCHSLDRWTVVSSYLRDAMLAVDSDLSANMEVLPLPHDETIFYSDPSIRREKNLIVSVTRFTEQKRVEMLISAFALLKESNMEAKLEIYGTGPEENKIKEQIEKLGLNKDINIFSIVSQSELRVIYNRAGMVVLNSVGEGFGMALSEAMMCGAPLIGTDSGGITDIVSHEENGLLVPVDNPASLAQAIKQLLDDDQLSAKLSERGQEIAGVRYASSSSAKRYAEIVRKACQTAT